MIAHVLHACAILSLPSTSQLSTCRPVNLDTCQPVYLSSCRSVTCNMALYGVCILLRGSGGLPLKHFVVIQCLLHCTHAHFFHFRRPLNCRPVNLSTCQPRHLSTCQPVDLSTCLPVNLSICQHFVGYTCGHYTSSCNIAIYGVCILLLGV